MHLLPLSTLKRQQNLAEPLIRDRENFQTILLEG
jgi:hypothetical protein